MFPLGGFMVLTQLPHLGEGQCYVQRSCVESPGCPPGTSPSPWPPQTKVPPSPLLGLHAPHSFENFLLRLLITTAWETPPHWRFSAQTRLTPPLPASAWTGRSPSGFLGILLWGSEIVYLSPSLAKQNLLETVPHPFLEETRCWINALELIWTTRDLRWTSESKPSTWNIQPFTQIFFFLLTHYLNPFLKVT